MSDWVKVAIQPAPEYWLPWSVFNISGLPYRASASSGRLHTEAGIERIGRPPGQQLKGLPINDRQQIQKPVIDGYVGDFAAPNLIGPLDCQLSQQVWINAGLWVLLALSLTCNHVLLSSECSAPL